MTRPPRTYRPAPVAGLEPRLVLDRALAAAVPALVERAARRGPVRVGALGDSYTDEYRTYTPDRSRARNWVEILAATRRIDFGAPSRSGRGEPRNAGFANNWARSDSTTDGLVDDQLPGLLDQVRRGRVQYAWVFSGGNDFLFFLRRAAADPALRADPTAGLAAVEARAETNLRTAVGAILAASPDVKVVLATVPDVRALPIVAAVQGFPGVGPLVEAGSAAIARYNRAILDLAGSSPRIALADLAGRTATLNALAAAGGGTFRFGGRTVDARTVGDDYRHLFLADGIHIGTIGQGLIANEFLAAINGRFGTAIKPLSPREIVRFAARVPGA